MTDQQPMDTTPPAGDPLAGEASTDAPRADQAAGTGATGSSGQAGWSDTTGDAGAGSARAREWMSQLETMIQEIATQAAPVARQVGAKAAELAAVAATKAGPIAQKAAEVTTEYGARFAERAQAVAAELRAEDAGQAPGNGHAASAPDAPAAGTPEPADADDHAETAPLA